MIRLTGFLWVWFQCVCPLKPSCNTYCLTWISLTLEWGISSRLPQQSAADALYLVWVVSPYCRPSWPWMWNSSSRPALRPCSHSSLDMGLHLPGTSPNTLMIRYFHWNSILVSGRNKVIYKASNVFHLVGIPIYFNLELVFTLFLIFDNFEH